MDFNYTQAVLSWSPTSLRTNAPRPDKLVEIPQNKDGSAPAEFKSADQYYGFLIEGVLEESWGILKQGLIQNSNTPFVNTELLQVQAAANINAPTLVSLRPVGGNWGDKGFLSSFLNSVVELEHEGYGISRHSMLGFCGHQAEIKQGILRVKITCTPAQLREMSASCAKSPAGGWKIRPLGVTLVTQHRMCEALVLQPDVAFMHSLITGKGGAALDANNPFLSMSSDGVGSMLPRSKSAALDALNVGQTGAMGAFLSAGPRELHCVVGPPGTGKTFALSALLRALVDDGKRCLVTAPSNKAVQVLAERFKHDITMAGKSGINISMLAADDKMENSKYLRECYTNTWGEANCERIQVILEKIAPFVEKASEINSDDVPALQSAQNDILNVQKDIRKHAPTHDNKNNISKNMKTAAETLGKIATILQPEVVKRKPSANQPKKPTKKETKKDKKAQKKRGGAKAGDAALASESAVLGEEEQNGDEVEASSEPQSVPDVNGSAAALETANAELENLAEQLLSVQEALQAAQESLREGYDELELLNHAQVIFGTLAVLGRSHIRAGMRPVDVLIVDEAAQSTEAETCIAFQFKPQKCLLVGDTRQLPATVFSKEAEKLGYGRSLMSRLIDQCKYAHTILTTQYRMHPDIRNWPSRRFYADRLRDDKCVIGQHRVAPWHAESFLGPYGFVDCEDGVEQRRITSYSNEPEALLCVAILRHLQARYGVDIAKRAAIITFYAGQVEVLNKTIAESFWGDGVTMNIPVHTVDSFQGCETDIVLLSMVRANQKEAVGFLRDYRRLNVALTRGRYSVIIVGSANTLTAAPQSDLETMVSDARARDMYHYSAQVLKQIKNWRKGKTGKGETPTPSVASLAAAELAAMDLGAGGDAEEEVDDWESLAD